MLKVDHLASQIQSALSSIITPALEECLIENSPITSESLRNDAKKFAQTFDKLVSENLAKSLANAIDYYIRTADITGTIITNGSPTTHMASIVPPATPISGGKIPNTLGIN